MSDVRRNFRSPLLPVGIAMMLLAAGFSFDASGVRWLWQSEPHIAVLVAVVGAGMIGVHVFLRSRQRAPH